ncbi:uncharacterized protein EI90DRAFT_3132219 [Cantharellus anzutake]|uniref:uncharacterized protein n=1 Tax=Cantharellus anzutake TaxID=1750568 RepID=UPI0019074B97|nr:uncharacterized protein EI90DRAFT_3132219 [Cantharellus anzutake]KAF8319909.1 hypothetical protein EI90DRAFT_3132219 [Cantharellus anzutake]
MVLPPVLYLQPPSRERSRNTALLTMYLTTCGLVIDATPRAGTSFVRPVSNRRAGAESPSLTSQTVPSTTSSRSSSERHSRSNFDHVVASSMHNSAVFVKAVNEDGLVPHEPVPLVDLNLPIPPIPNLVGDDDEVEQVPVPKRSCTMSENPTSLMGLILANSTPSWSSSFLMGMALDRFKPDLLEGLPEGARPLWMDNFQEFILELKENFSPHDPMGDAEDEILQLSMKDGHHINRYC